MRPCRDISKGDERQGKVRSWGIALLGVRPERAEHFRGLLISTAILSLSCHSFVFQFYQKIQSRFREVVPTRRSRSCSRRFVSRELFTIHGVGDGDGISSAVDVSVEVGAMVTVGVTVTTGVPVAPGIIVGSAALAVASAFNIADARAIVCWMHNWQSGGAFSANRQRLGFGSCPAQSNPACKPNTHR